MGDRQSQTRRLSDPKQIPLLDAAAPRRIPLNFSLDDVRKLKSESDAIAFAVRCSGYSAKEIPLLFDIDAGQWSNILAGKKYFPHDRRGEFMDFIGNEILLMYGCEARGYDFATLRRHRSELEEENERLRAENAQLKHDRDVEIAYAQALQQRGGR